MATLRNIGSGISTVVVNSKLTRRICDTPIEDLLVGLVVDDDGEQARGCMGVGSVGKFGTTDEELNARRAKSSASLDQHIAAAYASVKT
jgi:hypothetical protein